MDTIAYETKDTKIEDCIVLSNRTAYPIGIYSKSCHFETKGVPYETALSIARWYVEARKSQSYWKVINIAIVKLFNTSKNSYMIEDRSY